MSVDYYALLGVPKFCSSQDEIRRAYLAQARFFHPDAGNVTPEIAHQKMQELNAIYDTLRDPDAKRLSLLDGLVRLIHLCLLLLRRLVAADGTVEYGERESRHEVCGDLFFRRLFIRCEITDRLVHARIRHAACCLP